MQLLRVILSTTWPTFSFVYSIWRSTYRREIFFRKEFQSLSWVHTIIPNLDELNTCKKIPKSKIVTPFSKHTIIRRTYWLRKSIESMIRFQRNPLNMIEARLSRLESMRRNEENLHTRSLTIPDTSSHIDEIKNHGILKTLTKIQFHQKILNLTNINPLTNWQVFILIRLNLIMNVNPILNLVIQFPSSNLCWLQILTQFWINFPSQHLFPCP